MQIRRLADCALLAGACAAVLAGCATNPAATPATAAASWMLPQATSEDLLYAGATGGNVIYAFSYSTGALVGKIVPPGGTIAIGGLCSDKSGYLYVTALSAQLHPFVYKYSHGVAGQPIETYRFTPGIAPGGCSVDAATGDLGVPFRSLHNGGASGVAVFPPGGTYQGRGYFNYTIANYYYCGFDDKGNLFVNGEGYGNQMYLAELRKGSSTLTNIALNRSISLSGMGQLQWDGHSMTIEDLTAGALYRFSVSGVHATVTGATHLTGWNYPTISWIQGSTLLVPTGTGGTSIGYWKYPAGGKPTRLLKAPEGVRVVTVSLAANK